MAITFQLQEAGFSSPIIDLIYDEATNAAYQMYEGSQSLSGEMNPLFHTPDNVPPELVRLVPENRALFFRMNLAGSTPDDTLNKINSMARWVDGPDQQAARYHTHKDVPRIELKVQINGSTNHTLIPVIYGGYETFGALFNTFGEPNNAAHSFGVALVVDAFGEGEPFIIQNELPSSPHFIEDGNNDGTSDGVNVVSGSPTLSRVGNGMIGGHAQKFTATAVNDKIASDGVTVSDGVGAWVSMRINSGTWTAKTRNTTDGTDVNSVTGLTSSNIADSAVRSYTDRSGNVWYIIDLSGSAGTSKTVRIELTNTAGSTADSVYDGWIIQGGITTMPPAFISADAIENRNDHDHTNQERINYVDVWGIPGDGDAIIDTKIVLDSATNADTQIVASRFDGKQDATNLTHWVESGDFNYSPVVTDWVDTSDAGRTGGSYARLSLAASLDRITYNFPADDEPELFNQPVRAFIIGRVSNSNNAFTLRVAIGSTTQFTSEAVTPQTVNEWSLLDMGLVNIPRSLASDSFVGGPAYSMSIEGTGTASSTLDFDAVILLPVDQYFIGDFSATHATNRIIIGSEKLYYPGAVSGGYLQYASLGQLWHAKAGERITRFIFVFHGDYAGGTIEDHAIGRTATISMRIVPRTRHLLGVT